MKLKITIFCQKDIKDLSFDCITGKMYSVVLDTDSRFFNFQLNHLLTRLNEGYLKISAPWRYLPEHREFPIEVYNNIRELTSWCRNYYLQLEKGNVG